MLQKLIVLLGLHCYISVVEGQGTFLGARLLIWLFQHVKRFSASALRIRNVALEVVLGNIYVYSLPNKGCYPQGYGCSYDNECCGRNCVNYLCKEYPLIIEPPQLHFDVMDPSAVHKGADKKEGEEDEAEGDDSTN